MCVSECGCVCRGEDVCVCRGGGCAWVCKCAFNLTCCVCCIVSQAAAHS